MARRKTLATAPAAEPTVVTVTVDIADLITEKLNELSGIEIARDAWDQKAPEQYGVTTLSLEPTVQYADGHLIDEIYTTTLDLYVNNSADDWPALVREKLDELEAANGWMDLICRMTLREYVFDIDKVHWQFQIQTTGPLIRTVTIAG